MEALNEQLKQFNIVLSQEQLKQFSNYYDMLLEWNKVMNLTAITQKDEVIEKHFVDSIALGSVMDLTACKTIIDVGTGAGFPGIPLKIAFPNLHVVLMDSLNKRVNFLNNVISELGLCDIQAVHSRAEDLAKTKEYRENFDLCVSRAVANLSTLSEYCIPFVKKGGYFISYKAGNDELLAEIEQAGNAITTLGGRLEKCDNIILPEGNIKRSFVVIRKCLNTPKIYPRKAGTATKKPL